MSESKNIAIQLSPEEFERLNAEAKRLNVSTEDLALRMVQSSLANINFSADALAALSGLAEIRKKLPLIDAVELAQVSREDLEKRGVF